MCYNHTTEYFIVVVQSLSCVPLSVIPWTAARQACLSFTISQSLLKLIFIEPVMPSNHLILCHPILLPLIFPSTRVFPNELTLCIWDFCFGPAASFFLDLLVLLIALPSSPVAYWTPSGLGSSASDVIYFCLFKLFMGFLQQEYWHGLPFSSSGPHFVRTLYHDLSILGGPAWHGS